jgi:hypothetical protein
MWASGFFRVHISEMSCPAGSVVKIGAVFMLMLVKIYSRRFAPKPPQGISQGTYSLHLPEFSVMIDSYLYWK